MGLAKCPDCGKMVSPRASACPDCGCPAEFFEEDSADRVSDEDVLHSSQENKSSDNSTSDTDQYSQDKEKKCDQDRIRHRLVRVIKNCIDFQDLSQINNLIADKIRKELHFSYPIHVISAENASEYINKISLGDIEYPIIIVSLVFAYDDVFQDRKYPILNQAGNKIERYFDKTHLSSVFAPRIGIITETENQLYEISDDIKRIYSEPVTFTLTDPLDGRTQLPFSCSFNYEEAVTFLHDDYNDKELQGIVMWCKKEKWANCIDRSNNKIDDKVRSTYRYLQVALFYAQLLVYTQKKYQGEIALYNRLFQKEGSITKALNFDSAAYTELKSKIEAGQPFSAELVDRAFPTISYSYHAIANDICNRTPSQIIKEDVERIVMDYGSIAHTYCNRVGLPDDLGIENARYSSLKGNMHSIDGIKYVLNCLDSNPERSISDIVQEYAEQVMQKSSEGKERADAMGNAFTAAITGTIASAIGTRIGTSGISNELRRDRMEREAERRKEEDEEQRRRINAQIEKHNEQREHNMYVDEIRKTNEQRRRNGQPELPVPPKRYGN